MSARLVLTASFAVTLLAGGIDMQAAEDLKVRHPAVQGQFYPGTKAELTAKVDEYLALEPAKLISGRIRALIAPHAGYIYSGAIAGQGFSQIPADIERVIIMAPSHRVRMRGGGSIPKVDAYRNVLGDVPLAPEAAQLRKKHRFFTALPEAHAQEHSLEVMLPFLQRRLRSFSLIPIVLGQEFDAAAMAAALAPLVDDPTTLVVASSDLSHYKAYEEAQRLDRECCETILAMDVAGLDKRELCGKGPVKVLLGLAKLKGWKPTLIDCRNSGDSAGDKRGGVVGYASIAFTAAAVAAAEETAKPAAVVDVDAPEDTAADTAAGAEAGADDAGELLSDGEQILLLDLARRSITAALDHEELPQLPLYSDTLTQKLGCFVTLHKDGQLRGCIGNIFPVHPLAQGVQRNALSAAFRDSRFPKVQAAEMHEIDLEISVLTQPREIAYKDAGDLLRQLQPGVHGVVISQGATKRSTYLPQVWSQIAKKEDFLSYLCRKGGMQTDAWRDPAKTKIEVYEAFVFGEKELARED